MASVSFAGIIKPYFTACFRAHMLSATGLDLWDPSQVQGNFTAIQQQISSGNMPPTTSVGGMNPCPEGGWDSYTQQQFLLDFTAWQQGGYQA
jgi:hypothetical protein